MRFLRKNKSEKVILVISDLHLGAGVIVNGQRNILEDFHHDNELVNFLKFYSSGDYLSKEIELIINGDFLDLLAVPYVKYFDDEFWSEEASLDKMKIILKAHPEVMNAISGFLSQKKKKIIYIIGNHDAELIFPSLQEEFLNYFTDDLKEKITIKSDGKHYYPLKDVVLKHGHEYTVAHNFDVNQVVALSKEGRKYFIPPWGSYYVTRVINKFKEEREHINAVRPIRKFLINGLIYDTLFTLRFIFANTYYFVMVRFISLFKSGENFRSLYDIIPEELDLFSDYETHASDFFEENKDVRVLILGHTHEPIFRSYPNGAYFINTGTWTRMYNLDFGKSHDGVLLTYAQIDVTKNSEGEEEIKDVFLNVWKGSNNAEYDEFQAI